MKRIRLNSILLVFNILTLFFCVSCNQVAESDHPQDISAIESAVTDTLPVAPVLYHHVEEDVPIRSYFEYLDQVTRRYDSLTLYKLDEHLLVRANPWIIERLEETDYYRLMARDSFVYDPQSLPTLYKGDSLLIPDSLLVASLNKKMAATVIDVNIPEFKLRILEEEQELYIFNIRVGQNRSKYLAMAGRIVDLRTKPGSGYIHKINRNPTFINPADNRPYTSTRRDDGRRTLLPRIPWIEPIIDGRQYGQLIHPTTNLATLGKAGSNGCVGLSEGDMWRVYYYAPLGTAVVIRYDLEVIGPEGDTIQLPDIYPGRRKTNASVAALSPRSEIDCPPCLCGEDSTR